LLGAAGAVPRSEVRGELCAVVLHAQGARLAELAGACEAAAAEEACRAAAAWVLSAGDWQAAVDLWRRFQGLAPDEPAAPLTFKVTCRRKGARFARVSSQALAVTLASWLARQMGWSAKVRAPDLEVRVLLGDTDLLVDLPLLYQAAVRVGGGEIVEAGMSQHVAWALARSAELMPGELVLDPMCGRGVTLVEAALSWPSCRYVGVDNDAEQLQ
ncbi:unnamed protein product, partial [Prorocentrum cordatum]